MTRTRKTRINILLTPLVYVAMLNSCSQKSSPIPGLPSDEATLAFHQSEAYTDSTGHMEKLDALLLQPGDTAPDFTLHSPEGMPFSLYEELSYGDPIVLIAGSYTSHESRGHLPAVSELYENYGGKIQIVMVYTIDAHPQDAISPYSWKKDKWIVKKNTEDGIKADQPRTYLDRRSLCQFLREKFDLKLEVLVDNPDNEFWRKYGQAPNMAYIIHPDKTVYWRQIWFQPESFEEKMKLAIARKPNS